MVGVAGFEPTTSPTPRVCASQAALYSDKKDKLNQAIMIAKKY